VIAAAKVSEASPDTSTNPKIVSPDANLPVGQPGFVLQIGAMTHEENAAALAESLQHDFPALVSRRGTDRFYRVVVGPYSDVDSALRVKEQLRKAGFDAFRTPWNPSAQ
jgi:cell division septation protein DedD